MKIVRSVLRAVRVAFPEDAEEHFCRRFSQMNADWPHVISKERRQEFQTRNRLPIVPRRVMDAAPDDQRFSAETRGKISLPFASSYPRGSFAEFPEEPEKA